MLADTGSPFYLNIKLTSKFKCNFRLIIQFLSAYLTWGNIIIERSRKSGESNLRAMQQTMCTIRT